jgi:hypothetical protein
MPPEVPETGDLIVIEGIVNTTDGVATVKVTHPIVLNSEDELEPETGATVTIRNENGKTYSLAETSPGNYALNGIDIPTGALCQLIVVTRTGGQYESDVVEMRKTPPIDSVYFNYLDNGLEVLVDTHDATGNSRFYQWTYSETWEYGSAFESNYKIVDGGPFGKLVVPRAPADRVYRCWKTVPSTKITIASTTQLATDLVSAKQLMFIPVRHQKLSIKYSIIVKQRAVTEDEYIYLSQLQKTTESVGGLFDPQPSQVYGNVKRVSEKGGTAIGYFSGGSYDQKRIFQGFYELPPHLLKATPRGACALDSVCLFPPNFSPIKCSIDIANISPTEYLVAELNQGISVVGFTKTTAECADCRTQGGVLTRPDFW